jgi:hypothetical protein
VLLFLPAVLPAAALATAVVSCKQAKSPTDFEGVWHSPVLLQLDKHIRQKKSKYRGWHSQWQAGKCGLGKEIDRAKLAQEM